MNGMTKIEVRPAHPVEFEAVAGVRRVGAEERGHTPVPGRGA